jgi:HSP20 family protein
MALIRWRPRHELDQFGSLTGIQDEINRLFDVTLGRRPFERMSLFDGDWAPAVDVLDDENKVVVKAELPGMTEKDIDVSILGDTLTIKGEKKEEKKEHEGKNIHRLERTYGMFQRAITLPGSVAPDKTKASFKNGVLEIEMPKKEETKPKQIKVSVN